MSDRPPKSEMPVVILCGGKGTRLREETGYKPKPMVEIGDQPILWHMLYGAHGVDRKWRLRDRGCRAVLRPLPRLPRLVPPPG